MYIKVTLMMLLAIFVSARFNMEVQDKVLPLMIKVEEIMQICLRFVHRR